MQNFMLIQDMLKVHPKKNYRVKNVVPSKKSQKNSPQNQRQILRF
jgi:hypothetical protein